MNVDLSRLLDLTLIGINYDDCGRLVLQFDNATDLYIYGPAFQIEVATVGELVTEEGT